MLKLGNRATSSLSLHLAADSEGHLKASGGPGKKPVTGSMLGLAAAMSLLWDPMWEAEPFEKDESEKDEWERARAGAPT